MVWPQWKWTLATYNTELPRPPPPEMVMTASPGTAVNVWPLFVTVQAAFVDGT